MPRTKRYAPGDVISFRIPSDVGESEMEFINQMKREKGHKFTAYLSGLLLEKIREEMSGSRSILIPLPEMTEDERKMISNHAFRHLLGLWVYQLAQGKQVPAPPVIEKTDIATNEEEASTKERVEKPALNPKANPFLQNLKRSTLDDE
jgi:hypothetical protein